MKLSDYNYHLPEQLIAHTPAQERSGSRLLVLEKPASQSTQSKLPGVINQGFIDSQFSDIATWLRPGDLLVFNNTKVIKARLYGHKISGGKVEVFIERPVDESSAWCMLKASKAPKAGTQICFEGSDKKRFYAEVLERKENLFRLQFDLPQPLFDWLEQYGEIPLPPYIKRDDNGANEFDEERYQTVYGTVPGAVAAPTAGLHFDKAMLEKLAKLGVEQAEVTLHVGAGTFLPVRVDNVLEHVMHAEWVSVSQAAADAVNKTRRAGGRVIAVGTTSVRALESAASQLVASSAASVAHGACAAQNNFAKNFTLKAFTGDTRIFIYPGFQYKIVDALLTNFHLPQSTLLMLVSAMVGRKRIMAAYQHAIEQAYRFFSYGDAMFIAYNNSPVSEEPESNSSS